MTATVETRAPFATVEEAIEDIRQGRFVVVVDAEDRENEGDLTIAAQFATPEAINFMATHARGLICLCLTEERCDELGLEQMARENETPLGTAFTVSVEAREGVTTGISAPDRSHTIQVAIDPSKRSHDLVRPGHVFPLRAKAGGVLERSGQTEAAVDLARLAGLNPAGVVCEIMNEDGTMARVPDLTVFCEQHGIKLLTIADLIGYRRATEKLVQRVAQVRLPTAYGEFTAVAFRETLTGKPHVALVKGEVDGGKDVLVRVHSECLTGDVFHSLRCDCGDQLELALRRIEEEGRGVLLYMSQEGRGIGLLSKLQAYELQEAGLDTVEANLELGYPADAREWGIGNQILADLGLTTIRILTNNPKKLTGLEGYGLAVTEQVPIEVAPNPENERYLAAKRDKLGHRLHHQDRRFEEDLSRRLDGGEQRAEVPTSPAPERET
ncbi:MAG: bifunctional 3,4-dihydroxy-2-butanone-4-phosphate synthase/GTP cyclohydrolase II [Actinobacteria bacterium]|nr:bifunctional 3,4-dihydroxy-2-butanone-4-phosphate synthase/GTP cyclohydrolase II [Actinomycetota bacterium]